MRHYLWQELGRKTIDIGKAPSFRDRQNPATTDRQHSPQSG